MTLPTDAKARKGTPVYSGFLMYFPDAVREVARMAPDLCDMTWDIASELMSGDTESLTRAAVFSMVALQRECGNWNGVRVDGSVSSILKAFPEACAAVAQLSKAANDQHNPGEPMHWAREKSTDQEDCAIRHLMQSGQVDSDGMRHSAKVMWRCFAALQLKLESKSCRKTELKVPDCVPDIPPSFFKYFPPLNAARAAE